MELTTSTSAEVRAVATLRPDGSLSLKVTAHAEYAPGLQTSAEIGASDLPAEHMTAVREHLAAIVAASGATLATRLQHSMHESRRVGRIQGELDENFAPVATPAATEGANVTT